MLARVRSAAVVGLEASIVEVEVDVSPGIPTFAVVGLPDAGVREARERVRAAVRNSGYEMPVRRITVNLAPADIRKEGPVFDLPIALGILVATQQVPPVALASLVAVGELSLDGTVRPVPGVLSIALALRDGSGRGLLLPEANGSEASIVVDDDPERVAFIPPRMLSNEERRQVRIEDLAQREARIRAIDEEQERLQRSLPPVVLKSDPKYWALEQERATILDRLHALRSERWKLDGTVRLG